MASVVNGFGGEPAVGFRRHAGRSGRRARFARQDSLPSRVLSEPTAGNRPYISTLENTSSPGTTSMAYTRHPVGMHR